MLTRVTQVWLRWFKKSLGYKFHQKHFIGINREDKISEHIMIRYVHFKCSTLYSAMI